MLSDRVFSKRILSCVREVMGLKHLTVGALRGSYGLTSSTLYNWLNGFAIPPAEQSLYLLESILEDFPDDYVPAKAGRPPKAQRGGLPARVDA